VRSLPALLLLTAAGAHAADGAAAAYARAVQQAGLDPDHCYRVRDLSLQRDEIKLYLSEGHLIFSRAVDGKRFGAVFTSDVPGGDGEVILFPPHRSERLSLASFAKSPNLNEHFTSAVFIFTDNTANELLEQINATGNPRKAPEAGVLMADRYSDTLRNLAGSYEIRIVQDRFSPRPEQVGFFYAAMSGRQLGNFDLVFDPRQRDQITIGQLVYRDDRHFFDVWTSFAGRSFRLGRRQMPLPGTNISEIDINASIDVDLSMKAVTTITFSAAEDGISAFAFDLSQRMRVTEAKLDGQPVELFTRESLRAELVRRGDGNAMFLVLVPKPLTKGETHRLEFSHEGNVILAAGNGVYFVGARTNWYPNRDSAFARYSLTFRHPKALTLVATGEPAGEQTDGEWRTVRYASASPLRFAGFNLGEYNKTSVARAGVTIDVYANRRVEAALESKARQIIVLPPGPPMPRSGQPRRTLGQEVIALGNPHVPDPTLRLAQLAGEVGSALEFMAGHLGPPPLKSLTVSPIPGTFGQGFPGLVYLSTLAYLNPTDRPPAVLSEYQRTFFSELLHAHEAAHQWWGNLVTTRYYQDDWLMEALANYSAMMILEKKKGRRALDAVLAEYREHLLEKTPDGKTIESAGPIVWGLRLNTSQFAGAWRTIVYEKGSWIVHMLRTRMGDAAFLKMLGEMVRRYRYNAVTTEDLRKLAVEFAPKRADDPQFEAFFEQWVYGTGVPSLRLKYDIQGKAPKVRVRGTVAQHDVDEEFSAAVPVEVQLPGKKAPLVHWLRTSSEPVPFTLDLKERPVKVTLDPLNAVLARKQ
jgi:hypothetical protein